MTASAFGPRPPHLCGLDPVALRRGMERIERLEPADSAAIPSEPPPAPQAASRCQGESLLPAAVHPALGDLLLAAPPETADAPHVAGAGRAIPAHVERIDPTWLLVDAWGRPLSPRSVALLLLPLPQRRAVCRAMGTRAPDDHAPRTSLALLAARYTWSHLVDMPSGLSDEAPLPEQGPLASHLPRLSSARLHGLVVRLGVEPLGATLARVPRRAAALLCSRLSEPLRTAVWRARTQGENPDRADRQTLASLAQGPGAADPATILFSLGARRAGAFLREHCPPALTQCAQLLAKPAGSLLLAHTEARAPTQEAVAHLARAL